MRTPSNSAIALMIIFLFSLSSCKKEDDCPPEPLAEDSVIIEFEGLANGLPLEFLKPFSDALARNMRVELLKFYVSNIYLLKGNEEKKVKDVALITYLNNGEVDPGFEKRKIKFLAPVGSYSGIKIAIGLDPVTNTSDPTSFPDDHPLSARQLTHWGLWQNYKFLMIEGKTDFDGDDAYLDIFGFHTGLDFCYRERTFDKAIEIKKGGTTHLTFGFEINQLFFGVDTLDMAKEEPTWHGDTLSVDKGIRLSNNFINSLLLK